MYDAILVVSFGGPEKPAEVLPFLENVTRGRGIPRERLLGVAEHYYHFGGRSPINDQNRALIAMLRQSLEESDIRLPIFWGNRNWRPYIADALREMQQAGVRRALAFVTSAYSSYSGCRQYRENIAAAQAEVGEGAPLVDKLRVFYNHPGFVAACSARVGDALAQFSESERASVRLAFTAHSIPAAMAESSAYVRQLNETARLVAESVSIGNWSLVYQSRSGPPNQPWLEPDILDHLRSLNADGVRNVVIAPTGFISDHLEVLYDLDTEAAELAAELEIKMVRAGTAGTHPAFIQAVHSLIEERLTEKVERQAIGAYGPNHDFCPQNCCPAPARLLSPEQANRPAVSGSPSLLQPI